MWKNESHTPKWAPILGTGILMDSWIFRGWLQGSIFIGLNNSLYFWKALKTHISKMGLHDSFGHLKHKLWPKKGLEVKLPIWLLTTKSQESPLFPYVQVVCHIPLKISRQGLQLCLIFHLNQRSTHKVMGLQSYKSPNFGTLILESWDKMTFECWPHS